MLSMPLPFSNRVKILRKSGKKGKSSEKGKTGIVFASDDSPAANDELLDAEGEAGDNEDAESESEGESQSDVDASAAMKVTKQMLIYCCLFWRFDD